MTLKLDRVAVKYPGFDLDVSFETARNATALFGPSGAGKTTVLELIAGLRRPSSGSITFNGVELTRFAPQERRVGLVTQDDTLFPHLSVRRNILFGPRPSALGPRDLERVVEVLEIGGLLDRGVRNLSGGEKKRVALARALMIEPRLLLLDEPLAEVDVELREKILAYLKRVRDEFPIPIILVTHSLDEAKVLCHEVMRIKGGRVQSP